MQTIQMHLSENQKIFSQFSSGFCETVLNFARFEKKITLIAYVYPKLATTKGVLREMPKRSRLRAPQDRRHGKWAEAPIQC